MYGFGENVTAGIPGSIPQGGIVTLEDWGNFAKAAATSTYNTDHANLSNFSALRRESLEGTLRKVVESNEDFKLWRALKRTPVTSAVHEWSTQDSIGGQMGGSFNSELGVITQGLTSERRDILRVKLLMTMCVISAFVDSQEAIVNYKALQNTAALLRIARDANWTSYHGNDDASPMQFEGLEKRLRRFNSGKNVFDLNGSGDAKVLVDSIYEAVSTVKGLGSFGDINTLMMPLETQNLLDRSLDPAYRVMLDSNPSSLNIGAPVSGIRTSYGVVKTDQDLFINSNANTAPRAAYRPIEAGSPGAPTLTVTAAPTVAGSRVTTGRDGTYFYVVVSVNANGVHGFVSSAASAATALGGGATLSITPNADQQQTGYAVYRSKRNPATAPAVGDYRLVEVIPADPNNLSAVATYTDDHDRIPGSDTVFALTLKPDSIGWAQNKPATQFPLFAANTASIPWAVVMFGALMVSIPAHHALISNILSPKAPWQPY